MCRAIASTQMRSARSRHPSVTFGDSSSRGALNLQPIKKSRQPFQPAGYIYFIFYVLPFHFPVAYTIRCQLAAAAEIVRGAGDHVHRHTTAGVKVGGKGVAVGVDSHQHALAVGVTLKNQLLGLSPARCGSSPQHRALLCGAGVGQRGDPGGQVVGFGAFHGGAQGGVAVAFVALHPPLAAVVDGRARRAYRTTGRRPASDAVFIRQNRSNARYIVVIHKAQQVLAGVQASTARGPNWRFRL